MKAAGWIMLFIGIVFSGCSGERDQSVQLRHYPLDGLDSVITRTGVSFDAEVSSDGQGSLRIEADGPLTVHLFETGDLVLDDSRLIYRARVRTEDVDGQVYLEMWCSFPGRGEFFSRALHSPVSQSTGWSTQETFFVLREGEDPDNIKLNVAINGSGTVWVDDIRLIRGFHR